MQKALNQTGKIAIALFMFLFFFCVPVFAQHKYNWAKFASIPFKEDTCQSFVNWYTTHNIIKPITQSDADIEVRLFADMHPSNITIMKCYKDYIAWQQISVDDYQVECDSFFIGYKNVYSYGKGRVIFTKDIFTKQDADLLKLPDSLIAHHFFEMEDFRKIIKRIEKEGGKINYPEGQQRPDYWESTIFEVKFFNKYRNFGVSIPFMDNNPGERQLTQGQNLFFFMSYIVANQKL